MASTGRARPSTKDQPVIVAEGYMDVIALHGAGYGRRGAARHGADQGPVVELWKLVDEPYLLDGDNAGQRAAQRAADRALPLLRPGKSLRFLALPGRRGPRQPAAQPAVPRRSAACSGSPGRWPT